MIKGVSRQIIEINDVDSEYFERALLFISPAFCDAEKTALRKEARRLIREYLPSQVRSRKVKKYMVVRCLLSALAGAVVCAAATLPFLL